MTSICRKHPNLRCYGENDRSTAILMVHSRYVKTLTQRVLTPERVSECLHDIIHVRQVGLEIYGAEDDEVRFGKTWLSLNSHLMMHVVQYTEMYGSPRNVWVSSCESILGRMKRLLQQHRNAISAGQHCSRSLKTVTPLTRSDP